MGAQISAAYRCCRRIEKEAQITSQTYVEFADALTKDDFVTVLKLVVSHWDRYDSYSVDEKARIDRAVHATAEKLADAQ